MLSSYNDGKYLTRTFERKKNIGEWDSNDLTTEELSFYEVTDGEGEIKFNLEQLRRKSDGIQHSY